MTAETVPVTEAEYRPDIVIYHDHCADGFGAAWACWMRWRDSCQYIAANYGQTPPDVVGKHVLIVDFSYKADLLREMGRDAKSVIILDHHKTAQADLADWAIDDVAGEFRAGDNPLKLVRENDDHVGQPIAALFDMGKSGARLAWEFCHDDEPPMLIRLIEDRDLWRFASGDTKPFSLWLRSEPFDFDRWELVAQELHDARDCQRIMTEARAMQRFFDAKVDEIASFARRQPLAGYEPMVVNCPPMFASEVGHALLDKHQNVPFAAMYYDGSDKRMWSLRSRDDRQDVSAVASGFGGGGHRNAAGFSTALSTHPDHDALVEENARLREEHDKLRKRLFGQWFYPPDDYESESCMYSPAEVIDYLDLEPGDHVVEVNVATSLPSIWCAVRVTADEDADDRYTFTEHDAEDAARAALRSMPGEA